MSEAESPKKQKRPSGSLAKLYGSKDTKMDDTKAPGVPLLPPKGERSDGSEEVAPAERMAFVTCLITVFVDLMGQNFATPTLVPYASSLTSDSWLRGAVLSIAPAGRIVGGLVMPVLADSFSRKKVVWASMIGSCLAYALSASAGPLGTVMLLLGGRLVGGVFGQTQSMLTAYLMELTLPNMALFKRRQTTMMTMNQGAGLLLAPIGGFIAAVGLNFPFVVSTGGALLGFFFSLCFMKDVDEIKGKVAPKAPPTKKANSSTAVSGSSPWTDPTILLQACSYMFFGVGMGMNALMLPTMLEADSFGLADGRDVARTIGLMTLPQGIMSVLTMQCGYLFVSTKLGCSDAVIIAFSGIGLATNNALYMFVSTRWHLYVLASCAGFWSGFFISAFINMPNEYVAKVWPHCLAQARGVPFPFHNVGWIVGPFLLPLLQLITDKMHGHELSFFQRLFIPPEMSDADVEKMFANRLLHSVAWLQLGGIYLCAVVLLLLMALRIRSTLAELRRVELRDKLRSAELAVLASVRLETAGEMVHTVPPMERDAFPAATPSLDRLGSFAVGA